MKKDVTLTQEQLEMMIQIEKIGLEKSEKRLAAVATATGAMALLKGGLIVVPKALAFIKGSTIFLGVLPVPNYFTILVALMLGVDAAVSFKSARDKIAEEKAKNKSFKENELFNLEVDDDD